MMCKGTNPLDLFYLLLEQRTLVCRSCKAGFAPRHLLWYSAGNRSRFQNSTSRGEVTRRERVAMSIWSHLELQDPNSLPPHSDGSPAHPYLAVQCGMTCPQCRYHTTSPTLLQRHMAKEHVQRKCRDGSDKDYGLKPVCKAGLNKAKETSEL
jgi:hypothetical protein